MAAPVGSVTIPVMVPFSEAGGGVMTFVSKSGTNQYHGVAYDFLRNDDLDARGFFAQTRSVYKQNDFGGTAGGPVTIPKLYSGHNKTFFFGAYEGFRNRVGANALIRSIPTPEMYAGDFSNWVNAAGKQIPIYDPSTTRANPNGSGQIRDQFPGNIIPASRFSAFAKSVLPYAMPVKPNRGGVPGSIAYVQNNFISTSGTILNPTDKGSMRMDQALGANQRLGFFYNRSSFQNALGAGGPPGLPEPLTDAQVQQFDTSAYRLSHDWTISPRLLNHFSIGGNKFNKNSYSSNSGKNWKSKVCLANAVDCNVNFPVLAFSDESGWGSAAYNGTEQPRWSIKNDLTYFRGAHNFKLGAAFDSQRANGFGQQNIAGRAGFSYLGTSVPGASSTASGSAFASFLLGWADNGNTETIRYVPQTFPYYGFFVQDDWHITRRLTMNIGLRYEFTRPRHRLAISILISTRPSRTPRRTVTPVPYGLRGTVQGGKAFVRWSPAGMALSGQGSDWLIHRTIRLAFALHLAGLSAKLLLLPPATTTQASLGNTISVRPIRTLRQRFSPIPACLLTRCRRRLTPHSPTTAMWIIGMGKMPQEHRRICTGRFPSNAS